MRCFAKADKSGQYRHGAPILCGVRLIGYGTFLPSRNNTSSSLVHRTKSNKNKFLFRDCYFIGKQEIKSFIDYTEAKYGKDYVRLYEAKKST